MTRATLLTKEACSLCIQAKEILDRLAGEYDLQIEVVSVETPEGQAVATEAGLQFPPGLLLDGEPFSHGRLSENKLRRALEQGNTR